MVSVRPGAFSPARGLGRPEAGRAEPASATVTVTVTIPVSVSVAASAALSRPGAETWSFRLRCLASAQGPGVESLGACRVTEREE